jgi:hypothetical protein
MCCRSDLDGICEQSLLILALWMSLDSGPDSGVCDGIMGHIVDEDILMGVYVE